MKNRSCSGMSKKYQNDIKFDYCYLFIKIKHLYEYKLKDENLIMYNKNINGYNLNLYLTYFL